MTAEDLATATMAPPTIQGFQRYDGPWTSLQAAHLLRRTTYGPTQDEIDRATQLGMRRAVNTLFDTDGDNSLPLYYNYNGNPRARNGETFIGVRNDGSNRDRQARLRSFRYWYVLSLSRSSFSIRDKMAAFWTNHFGMSNIRDGRLKYDALELFRRYATGNFRELVKEVNVHPMMLRFLNGHQNRRQNPNENYAREFLELFTIGKREQVGPGDYTTYTEDDVTALARVFTGWRTSGLNDRNSDQAPTSRFVRNRHDRNTKQLSARLGSAVINNADEQEHAVVTDLVFQQEEVSRFICRKLYRHFVYYEINEEVERRIIRPMAANLRRNDYHIRPALRALLRSQHFYEVANYGAMIKPPLDFALSILRPMRWFEGRDTRGAYLAAREVDNFCTDGGMEPNDPPTVSGWEAYFQEPSFYRLWLNTNTIQQRAAFSRQASVASFRFGGSRQPTDLLGFVEQFSRPEQVNDMIDEFARRMLAQPLAPAQAVGLKELLLPGLGDRVWTSEYTNLQNNPGDMDLRGALEQRLRNMAFGLFQLAEFQSV